MTRTTFDPNSPTTDDDRKAVETRVYEIREAARVGDTERLASYHLYGPKFTKFDDMDPLERQEAEEARAGEDSIGDIENFTYEVAELRVDAFGPTAVATFVLDYGFDAGDDRVDVKARTTLIFVADGPEWRIAHEHLALQVEPLKSERRQAATAWTSSVMRPSCRRGRRLSGRPCSK